MSARKSTVLRVGLAGVLPAGHRHADLVAGDVSASAGAPPVLPPVLRRERKVRVIVEAAQRALAGVLERAGEGAARRCGFLLVTRYDARPANLVDPETGAVRSFGDLSPSTVALSLVPHMAASCVLGLQRLRGPALSLTSRDGLDAALAIAERWLGRSADLVLVVESDLALPAGVRGADALTEDYALAVLLARPGHEHSPATAATPAGGIDP